MYSYKVVDMSIIGQWMITICDPLGAMLQPPPLLLLLLLLLLLQLQQLQRHLPFLVVGR